jgi:hypothetical protein
MPKGAPAGKRINWDETNRGKLLFAMIDFAKAEGVNWNDIANKTGIDGVTGTACQ